MPSFYYQAKDKNGARVEGTIEADARPAVITRLQQMGYFPIKIEASSKASVKSVAAAETAAARGTRAEAKPLTKNITKQLIESKRVSDGPKSYSRNVSSADIAAFNRQLADLIGAGIPLVKALAMLQKQTGNEKMRDIIVSTLDDVQEGSTFAEALGRHPKVFSKLYVAMVKSGEAGGMLNEVLERLADFSEQEEQLRGKIKSALAYPVVMILAGSVAVGVMFGFVIPKITATFKQLNQSLPFITQLLIQVSNVFQYYWWIVLIVASVVGFLFYNFISTPDGKLMWHRFQLSSPLIGPLTQKREVARFCRTLGSLLRNGVSILTALDIVREVVDNIVIRSEVERIIDRITQGANIADPLRESQVFPPIAVNMISIGEETGRLPEVLLRVSESFEIQVERQVRTLTSLIEPLIIVAMGVVVGFIVIAMLLPIFSLDPSARG